MYVYVMYMANILFVTKLCFINRYRIAQKFDSGNLDEWLTSCQSFHTNLPITFLQCFSFETHDLVQSIDNCTKRLYHQSLTLFLPKLLRQNVNHEQQKTEIFIHV